MKPWRDGMGRLTIKADTGAWPRGAFVPLANGCAGVVRAPGWAVIYGPVDVNVSGVTASDRREQRERMAARARYHWRQRHWPRAMRLRGFGPRPDHDDD